MFLAADLTAWSYTIADIGAGLEATLGATAGSLVIGLALRDFRLGPAWPALGWLLLLAMTSQVIGWLLITTSMPRLPAWLVGALLLVQPIGSLLLVQPIGSLLLGAAFLGERPSLPQLGGAALMLAGVVIASPACSSGGAVLSAPGSARPQLSPLSLMSQKFGCSNREMAFDGPETNLT